MDVFLAYLIVSALCYLLFRLLWFICPILVVLIGLVILPVFSFNILSLETVLQFGWAQYARNIISFQSDDEAKTTDRRPLFKEVLPESKVRGLEARGFQDSEHVVVTLERDQLFKIMGVREKKHTKWLAVLVYKDKSPLYGYLRIIKEDSYYTGMTTYYAEELIRKRLREEVKKAGIKVFMASGGKAQFYEESEAHVEIDLEDVFDFGTRQSVFCKKEDYPKIKRLWNLFLGDNLETCLFQIEKNYNPVTDGPGEESFWIGLLGRWWFKSILGLVIVFFVLLSSVFC